MVCWVISVGRLFFYSTSDSKKRILAIWNIFEDPCSVGDFIVLMEFTLVLRELYGIDKVDICLLCDQKKVTQQNSVERLITQKNYFIYLEKMINYAQINPFLGSLLVFDSGQDLELYIADNSHRYKKIWPSAFNYSSSTSKFQHHFDFIQNFYKTHNYIPGPPMKQQFLDWANYFFKKNSGNRIPIVIQWRNDKHEVDGYFRNTRADAWIDFIDYCAENHSEVLFFIICTKNEIDRRLSSRKNVIFAKDFNTTIAQDLALILEACMYIGPFSGPMNMAMFSDVPYMIVNFQPFPDQSIEPNKNLIFAKPLQRLIWRPETAQILIDEFEDIFSRIEIKKWQSKFWEKAPDSDPFIPENKMVPRI